MTVLTALLALLRDATVIAALLALGGGAVAFLWQRRTERRLLQYALFAELRHVIQHYSYASSELPPASDALLVRKRLRWSRFGELAAVRELSRYAALGAAEMQLLLQLSFRIRNTDDLLADLLADGSTVTEGDITELRGRMGFVSRSASHLLHYLEQQNPDLTAVPEPEAVSISSGENVPEPQVVASASTTANPGASAARVRCAGLPVNSADR